jgi:hypothetical protein
MRRVASVKGHAGAGVRGRRRRATWLATVALLAAGCAKPYDPFRVPRDELRGRVRTIALAPLRVDPDVVEDPSAHAWIEGLATARLVAGGFAIVEPREVERLWREAAADVGTVFDPVSGQLDKTRFELVEDAVYRELATRHRVDAVLYLHVYNVDLYLTGATVRFCGREDAAYWPGGLGLLDRPTLVRAACLGVSLYDMDERLLYTIKSGIEPLETYVRQTRAVRPVTERLQNGVRLQRAVDDALGRLADASAK